jgi:hypothetical protein
MLAPGRVDIAAHCAARGPRGRLVPVGPPVAQDSYTFERLGAALAEAHQAEIVVAAVEDGRERVAVLRHRGPQQGDLTVGPFASACPPR